jgi:6-phospho-beta-glucosidase
MTANIVMTDNLEEAIDGADYVLTQIRVGKLDARILDEKIPMKYDLLGQETTGAGGFMKALRTIPVIMNIAEVMKRLAPKAWLINFTNPAGIITEAILNHTNIKMIGLCNVPLSLVKDTKSMLPENFNHFDYDYVGLNHLSWITSIYLEGKDVLPDMLKNEIKVTAMKNIFGMGFDNELLRATKGIPSTYLNYYYFREAQIQHYKEEAKTRGEICKDIEKELLEMYRDEMLCEKPALLDQRGGAYYSTAAISLIDAIENDKNEVHIVNTKNGDALSFMGKDDIVEIKCKVNKNGVTPIKIENFSNNHIIGLMQAVKAYEKLTVEAGLCGDYGCALAALLVHPLVGDYNRAKLVLDDMLAANRIYLPQFFKQGANI